MSPALLRFIVFTVSVSATNPQNFRATAKRFAHSQFFQATNCISVLTLFFPIRVIRVIRGPFGFFHENHELHE